MDNDLISPQFLDRMKQINNKAFELFMFEFEKTNGNFTDSFNYVANNLNITTSEVQYLYHSEDWAMKIVQRETENALVKQVMSKKTWQNDKENLYAMGQAAIQQLVEEFKDGKLPFDLELLKKDPKNLERFINIMEKLANVKMTGDDKITKSIIINQHNETNIDSVSGVDNDKINDILNDEGLIQNGEFLVKKQKQDKK